MKRVLPSVTVSATSAITATSADKLAYLCNVKRLSQWFYTGPRYLLSHNITPAKWATIHHALGDGFITKYADPLCLLGTGFGANTSYIMFDIDRGSRNHPSNDPRAFERFLSTLDKIGLTTPVIITSSSSGGIHVYYFFDRDINTFRIASLSQVSLIDDKFEIEDGTLELFPNCKDYGNKSNHKPHRSPLQPNGGGLLLDRNGNPLVCGANLNHETQLAAFLEMAKASSRGNNIDKILRKIDPTYKIFKSNPSKYQHTHKKSESEGVKEWREELEILMGTAWTNFHQTNELIRRFVEYGVVFLKLNNGKDLFEWAFEAITSANGYKQYCRHQHQIEPRIWDWIESTLKKEFYVPYCGHPTRSSDRDNFIAKYKNSKSVPTSKSEVYRRKKVESVASKMATVVETILGTVADLPSRIGDLIGLIQSTAREKFGQAFSNTTLHKPHYKHIWMKLVATKKVGDMVPDTLITASNIVYRIETVTEKAFEGSVVNVTSLPKTNLKPIGGETSHRASSVCSVNAALLPPPANEADLDLTPVPDLKKNVPLDPDSYLDLELKHISLNPTHPQSAPSDFDTNPQSNPIEPPGVDLIGIPTHDRGQSIESDPIDPDRGQSIEPDPIHSQSALVSDLPNFDTSYQPDPIDLPGADLITRSAHNYPQSIQPDPIEPPGVDLTIRSVHDRDKSIEPNPDLEKDLFLDRIDLQSAPTASLPNLDSNSQPDPIELSTADLTSRSVHDQKPTLKYFKSLSLDQKLQLTEQQIHEIRLSRFPLIEGCFVRPLDRYHVHGADRGIITEIQPWGVYVSWSDGTCGRYAADELIHTYSPN